MSNLAGIELKGENVVKIGPLWRNVVCVVC